MKWVINTVLFMQLVCTIGISDLYSSENRAEYMHVPFTEINGLIVVEAIINDQKGNYIFDTGANEIILNSKDELTTELFDTPTGSAAAATKNIKKISVGTYTKENLDVFVIDLSSIETYLQIKVDGIIGSEFFIPNNILLDFEAQMITLSELPFSTAESQAKQKFNFEIHEELMILHCEIAKKDLNFVLDSGSSLSTIDLSVYDRYFAKKNGVSEQSVDLYTATDKKQTVRKAALQNFKIGEYALGQVDFMINDLSGINKNLSVQVDGVLNLQCLKADQIIINMPDRTLYIN